MGPHGVPMNPHGYDLSFLVPAVVQPSVTFVGDPPLCFGSDQRLELGS